MTKLGVRVATLLILTSIYWPPVPLAGQQCDGRLWQHVYHSQRLVPIRACVTVTGTIVFIKPEADGDLHMRLHLDPAYSSMLNGLNKSQQAGNLVIEPICFNKPTQGDAIPVCGSFRQQIQIPAVGTHVTVTGAFVLDQEAGHGWNEIHPITSMMAQ